MANYPLNEVPRQVWAAYHPFYGTPSGPTGRWLTWNEPLVLATGYGYPALSVPEDVGRHLHHDPDHFVGPDRRESYSAFYPTLGLYDCLDTHTLEQHVRWALEASLDGFLWDYMLVGENNSDRDKPLAETIYDRSMRVMLGVLERLGVPLQLCPWYDSYGWYGYSVEKIADHLQYLVDAYCGHQRMLHFDGRLVVFLYNSFGKHTAADWRQVRELLVTRGVSSRIFIVGGELEHWASDFHSPGLFDGFTQYNYELEDWCTRGVARICTFQRNLARRNGARFWTAPVGPGFDGRTWHHPGRVVTRGLGQLYESMWQQAIQEQPSFITICSFNEWGEGTQIEPCREYDDLYLRLTARWARAFREGVPAPAPGSSTDARHLGR